MNQFLRISVLMEYLITSTFCWTFLKTINSKGILLMVGILGTIIPSGILTLYCLDRHWFSLSGSKAGNDPD